MQTPDQIRTVVRTLRDQWNVDLFPNRQELPKTLIFAKDDNHAEKIVEIQREEFDRGNEFTQKITCRTIDTSPEQQRIAVEVNRNLARTLQLRQSVLQQSFVR